jgi:hypothetical protein
MMQNFHHESLNLTLVASQQSQKIPAAMFNRLSGFPISARCSIFFMPAGNLSASRQR